ncbi:MAG: glycosyltransferase family 39 protein [Candidatus Latescibacteria bacterium]|nr:glycosyltransferase family 39 protein [Candidatus Latescibacterota bacterium]
MTLYFSIRKPENLIPFLIIFIFFMLNFSSVLREFSQTADEDKHYLYGERLTSGDSTRFDDSKMPVTALNAVPKKVASLLGPGKVSQVLSRFYVARSVTVLFSCLLAFLVFHWTRQLFGFVPALFSLLIFVLDPNIIAHSQLVTTDIYVTASIFFAFFALWKFLNNRTTKNGIICLVALGLSQIAKYTSIVLYPLFFVLLIIFDLSALQVSWQKPKNVRVFVQRYLKYFSLTILVSLLIINVGFLFNRTFTYFGEYRFVSQTLQNLQVDFSVLYFLPVPLPYPYLQGLDLIHHNEQTGASYGNLYLLGQIAEKDGFTGYFLIASLLKVPIATQIIIFLAFFSYFLKQDRFKNFLTNEFFLLLPVLFFTIYLNFFFNTQIGIRYYLPVFPFLYVFSGRLFLGWENFTAIQKKMSYIAILYLAVSTLSYYPYHLSYFNEIVFDRKQGYKYLADSNIDWGQDKNELDQYLLDHPDTIYNPSNPRSGHFVVRVNDIVGVTTDPNKYAWLRNNFEPVDTIAYSYLVYRISTEEIDQLCTFSNYCDK